MPYTCSNIYGSCHSKSARRPSGSRKVDRPEA